MAVAVVGDQRATPSGRKIKVKSVTSQLLALLVFAAVLAGCQEGFNIIVNDTGDQTPQFRIESLAVISRDGVEIVYFGVWEENPISKKVNVVWRIESIDESPRRLVNINYGVVPTGFRETTVPGILVPGKKYEVAGGMTGKSGFREFLLK